MEKTSIDTVLIQNNKGEVISPSLLSTQLVELTDSFSSYQIGTDRLRIYNLIQENLTLLWRSVSRANDTKDVLDAIIKKNVEEEKLKTGETADRYKIRRNFEWEWALDDHFEVEDSDQLTTKMYKMKICVNELAEAIKTHTPLSFNENDILENPQATTQSDKAKELDLCSQIDVLTYMSSATSASDWDKKIDAVKAKNGGRLPFFWNEVMWDKGNVGDRADLYTKLSSKWDEDKDVQ